MFADYIFCVWSAFRQLQDKTTALIIEQGDPERLRSWTNRVGCLLAAYQVFIVYSLSTVNVMATWVPVHFNAVHAFFAPFAVSGVMLVLALSRSLAYAGDRLVVSLDSASSAGELVSAQLKLRESTSAVHKQWHTFLCILCARFAFWTVTVLYNQYSTLAGGQPISGRFLSIGERKRPLSTSL